MVGVPAAWGDTAKLQAAQDLAKQLSAKRRVRRLKVLAGAAALTIALSAVLSLVLYQELRMGMLATGLVCALVVELLVDRVSQRHREVLRDVNESLEKRVTQRTMQLAEINRKLEQEISERQELQQKLMTSERMATAGNLAAGVSHEIRNPLTAIVCNLELAIDRIGESGDELTYDLGEALKGAQEGAAHVQRIAVDLATLANPTVDELGPVDIKAIVDTAGRLTAHRLRGNSSLSIKLDAIPPLTGSHGRLVQVFLNLIINAAQASRPGSDNRIVISATRLENSVDICVADKGAGIDPDNLERVFDPFFSTKRRRGGSGLGLSICREIVESCGGTLSIESQVGTGTRVHVRLGFADGLPVNADLT